MFLGTRRRVVTRGMGPQGEIEIRCQWMTVARVVDEGFCVTIRDVSITAIAEAWMPVARVVDWGFLCHCT